MPVEHPVRLDLQIGALPQIAGRAQFAVHHAHFVARADQGCVDRCDIGIDGAEPAENLGAGCVADRIVDRVGEGRFARFGVDGEQIVRDRRGAGALGIDIGDLEDAFYIVADLEAQRQCHFEAAVGGDDHILGDFEHTLAAQFQIRDNIDAIGCGLRVGNRCRGQHSRDGENQRARGAPP